MTAGSTAGDAGGVVQRIVLRDYTPGVPEHVLDRISIAGKRQHPDLVARVDDVLASGETCVVGTLARRDGQSGLLVITSRRLVWLRAGGSEILALRREDVDAAEPQDAVRRRLPGAAPWQRSEVDVVRVLFGDGEGGWSIEDAEGADLCGSLTGWVIPDVPGAGAHVRAGARRGVVVAVFQPVGYVTLDDATTVAAEWRSSAAAPPPGSPVVVVGGDEDRLIATPVELAPVLSDTGSDAR